MHIHGKKTLLFIEPFLSSPLLVLKAKEKGYKTLVISAHFDYRTLPEDVLDASSSLFQLDTNNEKAVLDLVDKIACTFYIDGVISGAEYYVPLTSKVAAHLDKPGLRLDSALRIHRKDLMRETLKAHNIPIPPYQKVETEKDLKKALKIIGFPCVLRPIHHTSSVNAKKVTTYEEAFLAFKAPDPFQKGALVEACMQGQEYAIQGFLKNNEIHLISMTEKFLSPKSDFAEVGYILRSEMDLDLLLQIEPYLKKVIAALKLNYGPFHAEIKLSENGPFLMEITTCLTENKISKLIEYATGIDYYDIILKLSSNQPLSLQKTRNLNAGLAFFYHPHLKEGCTNTYIKALLKDPSVKEAQVYYKEGEEIPDGSQEKHKLGYAILLHEKYDVLKQSLREIEMKASFSEEIKTGVKIVSRETI